MLPVYSMIFDVAGWTMALELLREVWLEGQMLKRMKRERSSNAKKRRTKTRGVSFRHNFMFLTCLTEFTLYHSQVSHYLDSRVWFSCSIFCAFFRTARLGDIDVHLHWSNLGLCQVQGCRWWTGERKEKQAAFCKTDIPSG